jgi:uncharacterized membrane protein
LKKLIWGLIIPFFFCGGFWPGLCRILAHQGIYSQEAREKIRGLPDEKKLITQKGGWSLDARKALDLENNGYIETAQWLFQNTPEDTVIAESAGEPYQGNGLVSVMSGRTALLGEIHVVLNHGVSLSMIKERVHEIAFIYMNLPKSKDVLKNYNVQYIIYGPREESAFEGYITESLIQKYKTIFQSKKVRILKVE